MAERSTDIEAALARYIPRHVLSSGHGDKPSQRDFNGVVLMLDIAGFTSLTQAFVGEISAGAERLSGILDCYFGCMTDIAVRHGGDVLDVVGDAVLVAWTCQARPLEIGRVAVQCGLAMQAALPEIVAQTGVQLRQRVSVASGPLTHFIVGGVAEKWHCLTAGNPLIEAAFANTHGGPDNVVVSALLWQQLAPCSTGRVLADGRAVVSSVVEASSLPVSLLADGAGIQSDLARYVSQPLLDRLRMGGGHWLGEFRTVTTLFMGVPGVDCTRSDALNLLQTVIEGAQRIHARVGGTLMRLSSDDKGVFLLAAFGLPLTAREDDAVRALTAAQVFSQYLREHSIPVNLGVATGPVFYADSGSTKRRHAGLTGGAVNLAARLMVASRGGILCDGTTRVAACRGFQFESCEPVVAKGLADPVPVWQPGVRLAHERRAFLGTVVGRTDEMRRMSQALTIVEQGASAAFVLRGEPGIGKSRLIADMASRARERGMRIAWGAGYSLETGSVYFPWRQIFAQMLSANEDVDEASARRAAAAIVSDDERLTSWLPLLDDVLPLHFMPTEVTEQMSSQARAASLRVLVVGFAMRLTRIKPLLLIADDLHWFDGASASLLLALISARVPGLMVLIGTRPLGLGAALATRETLAQAELIELDALSPAEVGVLISGRMAVMQASHALVEFVSSRTAGNPFYAEELMLALRTAGQLELVDGEARFMSGAESRMSLPDELRGIIVSRIDALGAAEQLVLKIAAVIGREFSLPMIKDLLPFTETEVDMAQVARVLEREDVVRPARTPGAGYRFKHALLQDTVYEQLPHSLRQELHGAVAQWIERNESHELEPRFAELAQHWERARNMQAAVSYLELSAAFSLRRYANREAIAQASRALSLAKEHKLSLDLARDARCEAILGDAYNELFEYHAASSHFLKALECAGRPVPGNRVALILDLSWQLLIQLSVRAGFKRRISRNPSLPWASHIHQKLGEIAYFDAGMLPLLHATLTSLNLAERSGTVREAVDGLAALAIGFYGAGQHSLSRLYNHRSLKLAHDKGGMADIAYANLVSGVYYAAQGHWETAELSLKHAVALYTRLGAVERWQQAYGGLCAISLMRGRFDQAHMYLDMLRPAQSTMAIQISAYLHAFDASVALATEGPLPEIVARLHEVANSRELAQFDRLMCQGLMATACWRLGDQVTAVEMAMAGMGSLVEGGAPAAWYVTDGLAGIAQTLIDACAIGMVDVREARRACRALNRYARATRVAGPRAALLSGRLAILVGDEPQARKHWYRGLALAQVLGTDYDQTLLRHALAGGGNANTPDISRVRVGVHR